MNFWFHDSYLTMLCRHPDPCRAPHIVKESGSFKEAAMLPETARKANEKAPAELFLTKKIKNTQREENSSH